MIRLTMKVTTTMSKKKQFPYKDFELEEYPSCCGIGCITEIREEESSYSGWAQPPKPPKLRFTTRTEQAIDFVERVEKRLTASETGYAQGLVALVSRYKEERPRDWYSGKEGEIVKSQAPEIEEQLLKNGWTIYNVFINPKHGNEITLYGKFFEDYTYSGD